MQSGMKGKREAASFLPYRRTSQGFEFFLQKRDGGAPTNPNKVGLFGGGLEGNEIPSVALVRETEEELLYTPRHPRYMGRFEGVTDVRFVFVEEVEEDFEQKVSVQEGEYGKFFTTEEVRTMPIMIEELRVVVLEIAERLSKES